MTICSARRRARATQDRAASPHSRPGHGDTSSGTSLGRETIRIHQEDHMSDLRLTRRHFLAGAASHKAFMEPTVIPMFEKKYSCKIIFEGTKSLVNLEKMVSNKAKPY